MSSYSRSLRRLFGSKCAKCNQGFNKKDYVMKVKNKIFHLDCFNCVACSKQLVRGEEFALRDNGLFCKADHIILEKSREHYTGEKLTTSLSTGKIKHRKYFSWLAGEGNTQSARVWSTTKPPRFRFLDSKFTIWWVFLSQSYQCFFKDAGVTLRYGMAFKLLQKILATRSAVGIYGVRKIGCCDRGEHIVSSDISIRN